MRAVIQRVSSATVEMEEESRTIGPGLLIFLGIEELDGMADIEWLCGKITRLRIFSDENGQMNRSVEDTGGEMMIISQFTLHASTKKGNRPSFVRAAKPDSAKPVYERFLEQMKHEFKGRVTCGEFGAHMNIHLINDGPVTIFIDTRDKE